MTAAANSIICISMLKQTANIGSPEAIQDKSPGSLASPRHQGLYCVVSLPGWSAPGTRQESEGSLPHSVSSTTRGRSFRGRSSRGDPSPSLSSEPSLGGVGGFTCVSSPRRCAPPRVNGADQPSIAQGFLPQHVGGVFQEVTP